MPTRVDRAEVPCYPDDLLPQLQSTLAILADIETRYEISGITWKAGPDHRM